jgi:hypothetical protein
MMKTLKSLACEAVTFEERKAARGPIQIALLKIHFPPATPRYLPESDLSQTYRTKPLVTFGGERLFGELAVLRALQRDGWDGVWVDTFHGRGRRKVLWSGMPPEGRATLPTAARVRYDAIVAANGGKSSGFFDVFAWRGGDFVFVEYKGPGDRPNRNEVRWIEAALRSGVRPEQLYFVVRRD